VALVVEKALLCQGLVTLVEKETARPRHLPFRAFALCQALG
jgi:hypothetical protein